MPFDGTELSQTKRDLIAARELLIDRGWVPHCGTSSLTGPNCIHTSVTAVTGTDWVRAARAQRMIYHVLRPLGSRQIGPWNDSQASIEPVLELLDRAIAYAPHAERTTMADDFLHYAVLDRPAAPKRLTSEQLAELREMAASQFMIPVIEKPVLAALLDAYEKMHP